MHACSAAYNLFFITLVICNRLQEELEIQESTGYKTLPQVTTFQSDTIREFNNKRGLRKMSAFQPDKIRGF